MGTKGTSTTVTQAADPWYKGEAQGLYNRAYGMLGTVPYTPYKGSQVAEFQPAQLAAQDFLTQAFLGTPPKGVSWSYQAPKTYAPFYHHQPFYQGEPKKSDGEPIKSDGTTIGSDGTSEKPYEGTNPPGQGDNTNQPNENENTYPYGAAAAGLRFAPATDTTTASAGGAVTNAPPGYPADFMSQFPTPGSGMPWWLDSWGTMPQNPLYSGSGQYVGKPVYTTATPNTPSGAPGTPGRETPYVPQYATPTKTNVGDGTRSSVGDYTTASGYTPSFVSLSGADSTYLPPASVGPGTGIMEAGQAADVARSIAASGGNYPMIAAERALQGMGAYRDPYESQVVGTSLADIERARQIAATGARSQATQAGAYGGARSALLEAETNRAYADAAARTAAQLRSQGFDRAASISEADANRLMAAASQNMNAYFQGRGQQLQGAGLLSSLGGDIFNRTQGVASAISALGAEQQNQAQNVIGSDYAAYQEAQNYPYRNFSFLSGLLTGVPQDMSTTQFMPSNRGAGFAGGALSGAGVGANFGPWGAAIGGGLGGLLGLF